jgi:hypothetical protein
MKGHGNPFSVTVDALVGARFPPIMGRCRHNDSHFLRALWTKQHPGVSKDCLVRLVMLHSMMNSLLSPLKTSSAAEILVVTDPNTDRAWHLWNAHLEPGRRALVSAGAFIRSMLG